MTDVNAPDDFHTDGDDLDLSPRTDAPVPTAPRRRRRRALPMVVLALTLVAGGVIVTQFLSSAVDFFCNVDEVGVREGCEEDRRIRLQGTVDEGSIESVDGGTMFSMTHNAATISVVYGDGDPGGIFQDCIPVVVHGEITDGVLVGDRVEVKHSDQYAAENDENLVEAAEQTCVQGA